MEQAGPDHGGQQLHPGPPGQVVVARAGLGQRGRLAGLAQGAHRQRRADQAERLEGRRDLVARQPVVAVPALPGDDDHAAVKQLGQVEAGGRRADPGQPGQFPRRQRAVRQQRPQDRGPGRVGDQRRGRREVGVIRDGLRRDGHSSTLTQLSFDRDRSMTGV